MLYRPGGRRVTWSRGSNAKEVRRAVIAAIRKAEASVLSPVEIANDDCVWFRITINPDSVVYEDEYYKTVVYPRRDDGSVELPTEASLGAVNK